MFKEYCLMACTTVFLCFASGITAQEDSSAFKNRFAITAGAGYQMMQMSSFDEYIRSTFYHGSEDEYTPVTGSIFINVAQKYSPVAGSPFYIVLELSKTSFKKEITGLPGDSLSLNYDYTFVPQLWRVSLGAGYRHKVNNRASLFIEASPVWNMVKADVFRIQRGVEHKVKDEWTSAGLGVLGKVGFEYYFTKSLSASANIGFIFAQTPELKDVNEQPIKLLRQPGSTLHLNFSGFNAGININYYLF